MMPIPIPEPPPPGEPLPPPEDPLPPAPPDALTQVQPYYVRDTQTWAVQQERQRHNQALFQVGEYAMFALMWHIKDHLAGLVERCPICTGASGSNASLIQGVYQQPTKNRCPNCFGTTFEGGYRALIVRPAIFTDADEAERMQARGVVNASDIDVESTTDFRVRNGDYVFRPSGFRYQLGTPNRIQLRTGFGHANQTNSAIGYTHARASYEDPNASVAYDIPPTTSSLLAILNRGTRWPEDFSDVEVVRGPLIPVGE